MKIFSPITVLALVVLAVVPARAAYEGAYVGDEIAYEAAHEDTFVHLARDYNLGFTEMRAANPQVDPWLPGAGTKMVLPTRHLLPEAPHEGIVINLPEMRLYAFVNGDEQPSTFPIGVGREGLNTPVGTTTVTRKKAGPTWTPTPRMRKEDPDLKPFYPPGPDNPLGTHALYLGWPTYAIHGTNRPFGIGRRISSGCIRMYPETITKLFEIIPVGTKVTVVDQPIKVGWIDDRLYIEAHANIEQSIEMEETGVIKAPKLNDEDLARIMRLAGASKDKIRWPALRKAVKERRGVPVEIARRVLEEGSAEGAELDGGFSNDGDVEPIDLKRARAEILGLEGGAPNDELDIVVSEAGELEGSDAQGAPVSPDSDLFDAAAEAVESQNTPPRTLNP